MKRLIRLYPRSWRERYGAEIETILERRGANAASLLDLLRAIVDAHLHPDLPVQLVFVPEIGFRPGHTRVLLERSETAADDGVVTVRAAALTPERTELVVEWESHAADSDPLGLQAAFDANRDALPVRATLSVPGSGIIVEASDLQSRAFSTRSGWSIGTLTFPPLPVGTERAELRITRPVGEWRVPLTFTPARVQAMPLAAEAERHGIIVRATGVARQDDEVMIGLEVESLQRGTYIGRVGSGPPPPGMKLRPRNWPQDDAALELEDGLGGRVFERSRLHHQLAERFEPGTSPPTRFTAVFGPVGPAARVVTLTVPRVETNELEDSVVVDLRQLPFDAQLRGHPFRVLRVEPSQFGPARRRMVFRSLAAQSGSRFVRPGSVIGVGTSGGNGYSMGPGPGPDEAWMDTTVGDPPLVNFRGVTVEIDGPWMLRVPLA